MNAARPHGVRSVLLALVAMFSSTASWSASTGSGSAYGLSTDLRALPIAGIEQDLVLGPAPSGVAGTAPPDFNRSATVLGISGAVLNGAVAVSSGTLNGSTQSTLPSNAVASDASVQDLDIALTLLRFQAQAVTSSATASCSAGAVSYSGASHLTGVSLGGLLVGLTVLADPLPNTTLINVAGVKIVLNEQTLAGNQFTVSAVHFTLNNAILTGLGVLSGDITVAKSVASMVGCGVPNLVPGKTGPATATVGSPFNYVLSLSNTGGGPSSGTINVVDVVPAGLAINNVTPGSNFSCGIAGQTVTCTSNTSIGAGVGNVTVATINVTPTSAGSKSNTATVNGGGDGTPGDNTTPPVSTDVGPAPAPNLVMSKSGPSTATVGTPFTYVLALSNAGTGPTAGAITVTDTVPSALTIGSVGAGANFSCGVALQVVTCTSSTVIAAGVSNATVATIQVTPLLAGPISNTATVTGGGDNSPGDNTSPPVGTDISPSPVPDLAISKSGPATATVGTPFAYALSLANVGTGPTVGLVTVTDAVQVGVAINSVVAGPNFSCTTLAQLVTCTSTAVINAGAVNVAVATLQVTPTLVGTVSNSAVVAGGGDTSPGNDVAPPVTTDVGSAPVPDLVPGKSGPATATVGVPYDYVLTLSNIGAGPTTGTVVVTDLVQAGLTIGSVNAGANFSCSTVAQLVSCSSSTAINAGVANAPVATLRVTPTTVGSVSNSAVVSGGGDNSPGNNTTPPISTDVSASPQPNLVPGKSGPLTATVGVPYTYALSLANVGTGPSVGTITVTDLVQAGVTVNSATGGPNFSCAIAGQRVTCTSSTVVNAGVSNVAVATLDVTPTQVGTVSNVAVLSGGGDGSPGDDTTIPVTTVVGPVALPDLVQGKTGPATATVGTAYSYALTLSNVGTVPTAGLVTVSDTLQAGLRIGTIVAGANVGCSAVGQAVTCTTSVPIGAGVSGMPIATITVTPTQVGSVSNVATVSGGGDNSPSNNTSPPVTTSVNADPVPDLAIAKSGPVTATVGTPYSYAISLSNVGTAASSGTITVTDVLQAGLSFGGASPGSNFACTAAGQTVTCTSTASIPVGATAVAVATLSVTPTTVGSVSNSATVSGGGDASPSNNTSPPVTTSVNAGVVPDLVMSKTGPASAVVDTSYDYGLALANAGTGPTSGTITVTDTLQAGLAIVSATGGGTFSCGVAARTVTCTSSATLAAGAAGVPVATIRVTPTQIGSVSNVAVASGGGDDSPSNNTSPPVSTDVGSAAGNGADLVVRLGAPAVASVGAPWAYTISVANTGIVDSSGIVTVGDTLPDGIDIAYVTAQNGFVCSVDGRALTCSSTAPIVAGSGHLMAAVVTVTAPHEGTIVNQAVVTGGGDATPDNNRSRIVETIVVAFDGIPNGSGTIPTLSEWSVLVMVLLLVVLGGAGAKLREPR